ncbi:hypothetical protein [Bradyrhizobium genosp. SA-3]|uniref:hypothetical protein n=1 Tax=Bradyrhizobium genosp. SA-3 TaxID=508868 RepID=UPI001ABF9EFC|nr:hypothetical protein [Bradyrhizobium genosp. SA-3]
MVDPISPMLNQLCARADQRERSVLLVEPFHSRIIEMRKLQLDDIAIPRLGVFDLFAVRQGREGGSESVGTMISLGVNAKQPQALVDRVVWLNSFVRNSGSSPKNICSPDTNKNANNTDS